MKGSPEAKASGFFFARTHPGFDFRRRDHEWLVEHWNFSIVPQSLQSSVTPSKSLFPRTPQKQAMHVPHPKYMLHSPSKLRAYWGSFVLVVLLFFFFFLYNTQQPSLQSQAKST